MKLSAHDQERLANILDDVEYDERIDILIENVELSIRTANLLKSSNFHTLGDLVVLTQAEFVARANPGPKSLREIIDMLAERGMYFDWYAQQRR